MRRASSGFLLTGLILVAGALLVLGKIGIHGKSTGHQPPHAPLQPNRQTQPCSDPEPPAVPGELSVRAMLGELVDLEQLATAPQPAFRSFLASSYDRRSTTPSEPATWFANDDWASASRPNFVRLETVGGRREYVLLDVTGPGALVRLWSATPTGTLRIYLDGDSTPVIEDRLEDLLSGKATIPRPFAYLAARGYNAYFPIPFRNGCKVTVDELVAADPFQDGPLERFYYQINYRTYQSDVASRIRTFRKCDLERALPELSRVAAVLTDGTLAYQPSPQRRVERLKHLGDDTHSAAVESDGGVVRELVLHVRNADEALLRRARLSISFDNRVTVTAPLGDFFGTGPGLSPYSSLPFTVGDDGTLICRWPMPFRRRASVLIEKIPNVEGELLVEPFSWSDQSLYFFARWRPEAKVRTHPPRDLHLLDLEGQGVYVGNVFNIANTPGSRWWGEGDEKVYVDRETFPSFFGTGTEDYYGYAWSTPERFVRALHAQTRADGPGFDGRFSMNRFHTLDKVPFTTALRFDLELWHWDDTEVTWDSMVYFYARPNLTEDASARGSERPAAHPAALATPQR